ncbi:MAG: bifunctional glutamate N-acetyltransferase/amino-acid acetyltransferase ArgJ [Lachnospiraceae bacterium]|nr:bifunctional glutamate N-acetyltransferase/amino-acid acetyltransferase ArgJ [Lachnospiraceae bacterium]
MDKIEFEGYKYIDGGVCAAAGFKANGLNCGYNPDKNKNDLCLVVSDVICNTAGVFTQNKVKGAPVIVCQEHLKATAGKARAIIANSKNANTCNADGHEKAEAMCDLAGNALDIDSKEVLVASTGVIGQVIKIEPVEEHIEELVEGLSYDGNAKAANAIMTTDTVPKEVAVEFNIGGKVCHLGGMGKGSGMIHPNMATTLNFITTDVAISSEMLKLVLTETVKITYNCLSIDGDQSTNDTLIVMANGLCDNEEITAEGDDYEIFKKALYIVMMNITKMLARDGEGATKMIECTCKGAETLDTAITVAKSVICSPLFKCAMFGEDANWGRILCAIGYADAEFDIDKIDLDISSKTGTLEVCRNGAGVEFSEDFAKEVLKEEEIYININLNQGNVSAKAWGCDLTYDYVKINGDYRS